MTDGGNVDGQPLHVRQYFTKKFIEQIISLQKHDVL
jgi:hypothetical protein